ncbi:CLUMA_CG002242, isoform A [Clunio marinus]|uniref:CLUMA_CG002242, isoform A n=1 Tax=Clunio marinus TaxID=568069 RepID=A0A1J1HQJ4_9DIPT|nr:CLUMA_CG002242, isoform A [Clunio marinus]
MVLATEIMLPPRRNSFNGADSPPKSPTKSNWWFFTSKLKSATTYGGSTHTVATQKLRESKWFNQDEERLYCAVIETGFIVEIMHHEQHNEENKSHYGVVSVEPKKNKKPTANDIFVYTVNKCENRLKVIKVSTKELWEQNYKIRINNLNDKHKKTNSEKEIKSQINYAIKHKTVFHNSLHFVDFCRYGEQLEERKRQVSESVKWGSVGMNAGIFLLTREKSHSFSK